MDKHLNSEQEQLFDLISQKNFDQLTSLEKDLVLKHLTVDEYNVQRKVIVESASIYPAIKTPPLVITKEMKTNLFMAKIPAYQTLLAIAATVIIMWLFNSSKLYIFPEKLERQNEVAIADTVFKEIYQIDTVYSEVIKPVTVLKVDTVFKTKIIYQDAPQATIESKKVIEENRILEPPKLDYPSIDDNFSTPNSTLATDETKGLIDGLSLNY